MKLTASKMSRAALASANCLFAREGRGDVGRLAGAGWVGVGTGSCESGKGDESKDDFELHIVFFFAELTITEY